MSSVMDDWFGMNPPKKQKLPPVLPSQALPNAGNVATYQRRKAVGAGMSRGSTILTGELEPMDVGKRGLLG